MNAARHTPGGTPVHVRVVGATNGIVLVVEDEGPGVPEETEGACCSIRSARADGASGRGMGIGLSLVRSFAELHGGSAHIEDRETGGARFVVTLPCEVTELAAPEEPPSLQAV